MAVFFYYAVVYAFYYSFTDYEFGYKFQFIGFENYKHFLSDTVMHASLVNQLIMTVWSVFASVFFPLVAAELLFFIRNQGIRDSFKKMFVFPMMVPGLVTMLMWKYLYNDNFGLNSILDMIGLSGLKHDWLNEASTAMGSFLLMGFPYVSGLYFLMFHAGLNAIGKELHDSMRIDGCTSLQVARYLHFSALKPYINVTATLTIIGSFQNYGSIMATTRGGPGYATLTPALHMFKVGFENYQMGYGSAIGVIIFVIVFILSIISRKLMSQE